MKKTGMTKTKNHDTWECAQGHIHSASPDFGLMGIVNLTCDSFFDGGEIQNESGLLEKVKKHISGGADIIDLGAESTRPGAETVSSSGEISRLAPAIEIVRQAYPDIQISVDTRKAVTAKACLNLGAHIINDISGLQHDPGLVEILADYKPGYVLTHSRGEPKNMQDRPEYVNVVDEIRFFFENGLDRLQKAGLPENNIALDPGIGFGKSLEHNLEIIRKLPLFLEFGRPLILGLSMKSLFGQLLGHEKEKRSSDTAIASAICWNKGVFWHRIHEPAKVRDALVMARAFQS